MSDSLAVRALRTLPLLFALAACRARAHPSRPAPRVVAPTAAPAAPPVAAPLTPAWTEGFLLHGAPRPRTPAADVIVHAPPGFDPNAPLHIVLFAHGMWSFAMQWIGSGAVETRLGQAREQGWGMDSRFDAIHPNALLIAPQFASTAARGWGSWFARPTALRQMLDELLGETLRTRLGRRLSSSDIASITLLGASAGGYACESILAHSDLADRVDRVVLFDGFYMPPAVFTRWMRASDRHRFVSIHGGGFGTSHNASDMADALRSSMSNEIAWNPRGALSDAVRTHRVVLASSGIEHVHITLLLLSKVLEGLGLPPAPRAHEIPDPKSLWPETPARAPTPLALGATVHGAIDADDTLLRDGSRADDFELALHANSPVTISTRGDPGARPSVTRMDTELRVLDGETLLARDDDGAGGFDSRLTFTPARDGRYVVRVTTHGPWLRTGGYSLNATQPGMPPPQP